MDRFKTINDTLGHDIGDLLLLEIANRLRTSVGKKEKVFRLGGDEFLVTSINGIESGTISLANRILDGIKAPCHIEGNELYVTASIGISFAPQHGTDSPSLIRTADIAMYQAKHAGKNKAMVYNEEMGQKQLRRMELEKDLRRALAHREFFIVYQPKWGSYTNQMVGIEALLRWNHPQLGTISPREFIPIAEETGIIIPITHWLIHEVCMQNKTWHEEKVAQVAVSVNLSIRVFESQTLYATVKEALEHSGLQAKFLELEITESFAMNDIEDTITQLQNLRSLGLQISLDDFGTGYSSLGSLGDMPIDILKIDQSFIQKNMEASKKAIINNIITIAKNLDLEIVAEGVETLEQIQFLQSQGCHIMQGFYYSKPVPAEKINSCFPLPHLSI